MDFTRRVIVAALFAAVACGAPAQNRADEYGYPFLPLRRDYMPDIVTDTTLFYRAVQSSDDLYARIADYSFSFVGMRRRGAEYADERISYAGLSFPARYAAAFRALRADCRHAAPYGAAAHSALPVSGGEIFSFPEYFPGRPASVAVNFSDRGYLAGVRTFASAGFAEGWSVDAALSARTGRDLHVDGVFTDAASVSFRLAKRFSGGSRLSLFATFSPSVRGMRSASVGEAFALRGDNLYNPSWGWQEGRRRNSRVRRDMTPLAVASYAWSAGTRTTLAASLAVEAGTRRYSTLGWYDARTPMPDNYRWMPSYQTDAAAAGVVAESWRRGESRYTQIDWEELCAENRMAGGEAVYAVEDRVRRLTNVDAAVRAETAVSDVLTVSCGIAAGFSSERSYRRMRDLLGAEYLTDIDTYLVDDDTFSNSLQNDLRHPDRRVGEGDRFGYDYALRRLYACVSVDVEYRTGRFDLRASASLGGESLRRHGYFEKELFPGEESFGASPAMRFSTFSASLCGGCAFTPRHRLGLSLSASGEAPDAEDLFWNPQYNNRAVDRRPVEKRFGCELSYRCYGRTVQLQAALFASLSRDGIMSLRYYDDLSAQFCDMAVSGIGRLSYGAEAAATVRLSRRWRLQTVLSAARYRYASDPEVRVVTDAAGETVDSGSASHMGGCVPGGAPQLAAAVSVDYFSARGWGVDISLSWAGSRYVDPSFLRRTERVARQAASSPEQFAAIVGQERLKDAADVGFMVSKRWYVGRGSRVTAMLSVRNLLDTRDIVESAYESQRVRRVSAGVASYYVPLPTRYLYAYPRTCYLSVSYTF